MRLSCMLMMCVCLLASPLATAHEGHAGKPKPQESGDKGKGAKDSGKPDPQSGRTALAEAEPNQRFCMKNKEGRVHCIPFGPH